MHSPCIYWINYLSEIWEGAVIVEKTKNQNNIFKSSFLKVIIAFKLITGWCEWMSSSVATDTSSFSPHILFILTGRSLCHHHQHRNHSCVSSLYYKFTSNRVCISGTGMWEQGAGLVRVAQIVCCARSRLFKKVHSSGWLQFFFVRTRRSSFPRALHSTSVGRLVLLRRKYEYFSHPPLDYLHWITLAHTILLGLITVSVLESVYQEEERERQL